jgi:Ca2+-binding RTX toxin-like protein
VRSLDGTANYDIQVNVSGADDNHAPTDIVLNASAGVVNALPVSNTTIATLATIDPDASDTSFSYTLSGTDAASFSINASQLRTAVDLGQAKTYQFAITTDDGHGGSYTEGFRVVTGTNANVASDAVNGGSDDPSNYQGSDVLLGGGNGGNGGANANNVDILFGLGGDDLLYGQGGRDQLHGGLGNDTLQGGADNDLFYFDTALNGATNVDRITDLQADGTDQLVLSNAIFGLGSSGTLAAADYGTVNSSGSGNVAGLNVAAGANIVYDTSTGSLYFDGTGGSLADAVQFASVTTTPGTFDRADIILGS